MGNKIEILKFVKDSLYELKKKNFDTNVDLVATKPLGLVNMPSESIVGTKTSGRHTAFAPNFMLCWMWIPNLPASGRSSATPIWTRASATRSPPTSSSTSSILRRGNKRVSVLKHFDAASIPGTVTRLIPARNNSLENRIYYEFMDFYKLSQGEHRPVLPARQLCQAPETGLQGLG